MSGDPCCLTVREQLQSLCRDDHFLGEDDLPEEFTPVDGGGWTQDCKYQHCSCVYKHEPTGRHFQIDNSRSGSYHTDWYYSTPTVSEVTPVTKTVVTTTWKPI